MPQACIVLASPLNKNIFVVRLGRKCHSICRPAASPNVGGNCSNIKQFENHLKTYLTYSPIALGALWVYLLHRFFKSRREFQKATGIDPVRRHILRFGSNPFNSEVERTAYSKLKRRSLQNFVIWIVSLLVYIAVTLIVGAVLADHT